MPRLFRKSALRSAPSAPQHLSFEPANGKPPQQPNTLAARPGVVVAPDASSLVGRLRPHVAFLAALLGAGC
jgi:hypothetical protein